MIGWNGLIKEYSKWFDLEGVQEVVTLQEGNTPLIFAERLSERLDANVYLKYEGLNPSGSFKDRGMTMAILPSGTSTTHSMPALAAYAAAAAEVLPVEPQITVWAPLALALVMAMVMPRSLKEPEGLSPSYLRYTLASSRSESRSA